MNNINKNLLAAAFILAGSSLRAGAMPTNPRGVSSLKITARVYNYAHISSGVLVEAEEQATRIFHKFGAEMQWLDCTISAVEARTPACDKPFGAADLILKLLPPSM